jgi:P4 family phage/plasmid primase-like protien
MVANSNTIHNSDNKIKSLDTFLRNHKYTKGEGEMSHTACGPPYGTFNIPDEELDDFYDIYAESIGKIPLHLIERPKYVGPLVIDIDYYTKDSQREYTHEHIKSLVKVINSIVKKYYRATKKLLKAFVFEKEKPTPKIKEDKTKKNSKPEIEKYKDGFHLIYPYIALPEEMRYLIIYRAKKRVEEEGIFDDIAYINSIDEVFDMCVVKDNGLTMPWSCKKDCKPYELTAIYQININQPDLDEDDISEYTTRDLLSILSNRKFTKEDMVKYKPGVNEEEIRKIVEKVTGKPDKKKPNKPNPKLIEEFTDEDNDDEVDARSNKTNGKKADVRVKGAKTDKEMAKRLVVLLSDDRAQVYEHWIRVGWALHNISLDLLETFKEFSMRCSDKYDEQYCEKLWEKAKNDGYSIGSLHVWAKKDNPKQYANMMRQNIHELFREAETGTEYDIAKIIRELYKHQYCCTSIKNDLWFEFTDHRWVEIQSGYTLHTRLSEEVSREFAKLNSEMWNDSATEEGIKRDDFLKRAAKIQKIILDLKRKGFKDRVISECAILFYNPEFEGKLDSNTSLIGFNNGVYDLKDRLFRDGTPDDKITFTVGYDYEEYDEEHPYVQDILDFFNKVHLDKSMRHYILKLLASYLDGDTKLQQFIIWTGSGANGKGRTIMLFQLAMGDYFGVLPVTVLTRKQGDASRATPEMAGLKGKRFVVFQEPENTDEINVGRMKELTGGDIISARPLFREPVKFKPQFKLLLACNKLPNIPSRDGGTWRRLRVSPWESEFIPVDKKGLHKGKKLKAHQFPRDFELDDKLELWKKAFMWLLLNKYYPLYQKEGLRDPETDEEPAKVMEQTRQYERTTDIFLEFFEKSEDMRITKNKRDCELISGVYDVFKTWFKETYDSHNKHNKKEFMEYLATADRFESDNKYIYGLRFNSQDDKLPAELDNDE